MFLHQFVITNDTKYHFSIVFSEKEKKKHKKLIVGVVEVWEPLS